MAYGIFSDPRTPWIIFALLMAATLIAAIKWWRHEQRLRSDIAAIGRSCGFLNVLEEQNKTKRWHLFADQKFEEAKTNLESLEADTSLARQVLLFLERCELVHDETDGQWRLETAVPPSQALRLSEYLLDRNVHVSIYRAFPNYLVGVGLCITFLGLAVVIGNASSVLSAGADGDSSAALQKLLVAASSKFWSSLTAVTCSIGYGICFRWHSQNMERAVSRLIRDLSRCLKVVTPEELHYESVFLLRRSAEYQSVTANGIGLLKSGLENTQASNAIQHHALLEKLGMVAEKLEQKLDKVGIGIGEGIAGGLGKELTTEIEKTAAHMRSISEEFEHLTTKVEQQSVSIAGNFDQASGSSRQVEESFQQLPDLVAPLNRATELVGAAAEALTGGMRSSSEMIKDLVGRWEELSALVQSLDQQLAEAVGGVGKVFPAYSERLQDFTGQWEKAMVTALGGLAANIKEAGGSHEDLRVQRSAWQESVEVLTRGIDEVKAQFTLFERALAAQTALQTDACNKLALALAVTVESAVETEGNSSSTTTSETTPPSVEA